MDDEMDILAFEEDMLTYFGMKEGMDFEEAVNASHQQMIEIHKEA